MDRFCKRELKEEKKAVVCYTAPMKKRALTLVEVLVGFTLFGILTSFLMLSFNTISRTQHTISQKEKRLRVERTLFRSLSSLFDKMVDRTLTHKLSTLSFETGGHIENDPDLFDKQKITLLLEDHRFIALHTSKKNEKKKRKELLLDGVTLLSFTFSGPLPDSKTLLTQTSEKDAIAVEVHLKQGKNPYDLTFLIPPDLYPHIELK